MWSCAVSVFQNERPSDEGKIRMAAGPMAAGIKFLSDDPS